MACSCSNGSSIALDYGPDECLDCKFKRQAEDLVADTFDNQVEGRTGLNRTYPRSGLKADSYATRFQRD